MIQGLYEIRKKESEKLFTMWLDAFHDYPKLAEAFPQMDKKLGCNGGNHQILRNV